MREIKCVCLFQDLGGYIYWAYQVGAVFGLWFNTGLPGLPPESTPDRFHWQGRHSVFPPHSQTLGHKSNYSGASVYPPPPPHYVSTSQRGTFLYMHQVSCQWNISDDSRALCCWIQFSLQEKKGLLIYQQMSVFLDESHALRLEDLIVVCYWRSTCLSHAFTNCNEWGLIIYLIKATYSFKNNRWWGGAEAAPWWNHSEGADERGFYSCCRESPQEVGSSNYASVYHAHVSKVTSAGTPPPHGMPPYDLTVETWPSSVWAGKAVFSWGRRSRHFLSLQLPLQYVAV